MDSPHSQTAAQPRSAADNTAHPADTSSLFENDETPTWKKTAGRFMKSWKRTKRVTNTDGTANMNIVSAGAGVTPVPDAVNNSNPGNNDTAPSASSSPSHHDAGDI
ncbi:hypothetical protein TMatcc_010674 [Talaromyces marneffei ATCC 18224]